MESGFVFVCNGIGFNDGGDCNRYIRTKKKDDKENIIFLFEGRVTHQTKETQGWPEYKFTFKKDIVENKRVYYGQCSNETEIESEENLCSKVNLPEGWTIEKLSVKETIEDGEVGSFENKISIQNIL